MAGGKLPAQENPPGCGMKGMSCGYRLFSKKKHFLSRAAFLMGLVCVIFKNTST
jgi:hypothetical protein